jgi:hypothetical protein
MMLYEIDVGKMSNYPAPFPNEMICPFISLAGSRETQQISQSAWSAVTPHHHTATDRYQHRDSQRSRQPQDQPQNPKDRYATAADTPENERTLIQVRHNLVFRAMYIDGGRIFRTNYSVCIFKYVSTNYF